MKTCLVKFLHWIQFNCVCLFEAAHCSVSDILPTGGDSCTWSGIFVADKLESWREFWDPGGQGEWSGKKEGERKERESEREEGRGERGWRGEKEK